MRDHGFTIKGALTATLLLLTGCATHIRITSDPPGADIMSRGSGRSAYRWEYKGREPVTFKVYYTAIQTVAKWPDGRLSDVQRTLLRGQREVSLILTPQTASPPTLPPGGATE